MPARVGLILRLLGPLLQVVSLILLLGTTAGEVVIAGTRLEPILYAGFLLGFVLVVIGLFLSRVRVSSR